MNKNVKDYRREKKKANIIEVKRKIHTMKKRKEIISHTLQKRKGKLLQKRKKVKLVEEKRKK